MQLDEELPSYRIWRADVIPLLSSFLSVSLITAVLLPLLHAGWISLFQWDGVTVGRYVGLQNYRDAVSDPAVLEGLAALREATGAAT